MQIDLLKEVVSRIAGSNAEPIVAILHKKKNVNEFLIAKKLDLTINQTRNILYKLADVGLVSFIRKKDTKKGGWYIYFWTLNAGKAIELLHDRISEKVHELESEIERRKNRQIYYSPDADIEYTEEEALENDFICPETGEVMELKDTSEDVKNLEKEIKKQADSLEAAKKEFDEIKEKEHKARERKLKADKKKKDLERARKREERKKEREKEKAKLGKKKTTKKTTKKKTAKKSPAKKTTKKASSKKTTKKTAKKSSSKKK